MMFRLLRALYGKLGASRTEALMLAATASGPEERASLSSGVSFAFLRLPPLPFVPEPLQGRFTMHVRIAYLGAAADGERLIADLRAAAPTLIDTVAEMPFTAIAAIHADPVEPIPTYEISSLLYDFPPAAADALIDAAGPDVGSPTLVVEIRQLGGALADEPASPNAVGNRDARFQVFAGAVGGPGMGETFRRPLEDLVRALAPWSTGRRQINYLGGYDTEPQAVATAYDPATYERLVQIKTAHDPRNLFRINHNIPRTGDRRPGCTESSHQCGDVSTARRRRGHSHAGSAHSRIRQFNAG